MSPRCVQFVSSAILMTGWAVATHADPPKPMNPPDRPVLPNNAAEPADPTFAFEWVDAKWADVLDWYAGTTGLAWTGDQRPTGMVTLRPGRRLTLLEITDIVNQTLAQQKLLLARREVAFTLVPADKPLDPNTVPQVKAADLGTRGHTEPVLVRVAVKGPFLTQLPRLLTPLGTIVGTNGPDVLICDTAGSVARVLKVLDAIDK